MLDNLGSLSLFLEDSQIYTFSEPLVIPNPSEKNISYTVDLAEGENVFTFNLYDTVGNKTSAEITINLTEIKGAAKEFVDAAKALASVAEIKAMDADELALAKTDIQAVRDLYDNLPNEAKEFEEVILWEGYLTLKEEAVIAREGEL